MNAMASQITGVLIVCSTVCSGLHKNINAPRHWPLLGEPTVGRWVPLTKDKLRGKCFHLMASSCVSWNKYNNFKIQDSRMVYCNFNRNLHGMHLKTKAQVVLFVLNTIKLNCITLTSLVQQVSKGTRWGCTTDVHQHGLSLHGMTFHCVRMPEACRCCTQELNLCAYVPGCARDFSCWSHINFSSSI